MHRADKGHDLSAPLLFARSSIIIAIHFHVWAVLKEILGFLTRFHLAAVNAAVARKRGLTRGLKINGGHVLGV